MRVVWDAREQRNTPYSSRRECARAGLLQEDPVERETDATSSPSACRWLVAWIREYEYSLERFFGIPNVDTSLETWSPSRAASIKGLRQAGC